MGGLGPVSGSAVTLYRAGSSFGGGATSLGSTTSATDGSFSIPFIDPPSGTVLYLTAIGGDTGKGNNSAIGLMAVIGRFGSLSGSSFRINELTTVGSVWALAQFMNSSGHILGGPSPGLENAASATANLADVTTGQSAASLATGNNSAEKLNTTANILAPCVNSSGPGSPECASLFAETTPPGGVAPSDTLEAARDIALNPAANVLAIFNLALSGDPFAPSLSSPPTDWTLSVNFAGGGIEMPTAVAIDGAGNVWIANLANSVSKLSPDGTPLSPAGGFVDGGLVESMGIAIDGSGNAWVTNQESPPDVNSGQGTLTKLRSDGTPLSGTGGFSGGGIDFPDAVAIATDGSVWVANFGLSGVTKFDPSGNPLSPPSGFTGGGLNFPVGIAVDASGGVWLSNQSNSSVTLLDGGGSPISPADGFTGGGIDTPFGIALDGSSDVWVANFLGDSVTKLQGSESSSPGDPVSPPAGFGGGGLDGPAGIAVDGAGNAWVANFRGASLTELASDGSPISMASGFNGAGLDQPFGIAIDASGNVWVANFNGDSVTEFVGVAAPVKTPLIGPPKSP